MTRSCRFYRVFMKSLNDVWQNWRKYLKIMAVHNFKMILEFWNLCFNEFQRHMMRQVPDHGAKIQAEPSRSKRCRPVPSSAKAETIDVCCLLCELAAKLGSLGTESVESVESVVRTS